MSKSRNNLPCILLIEDDREWLAMMRDVLSAGAIPMDLHVISGGVAAIDYLRGRRSFAKSPRPDLIILDMGISGALGRDLLKVIKADADLGTIPVIVLSGSDHREQQQAVQSGADAYIVKRNDLQELGRNVNSLIGQFLPHQPRDYETPPSDVEANDLHISDFEERIQHPTILIVEDDPDQRELIMEVIGAHFNCPQGGNIVAVGTAGAALAENLERFDIVLLDFNLPDMPGLTLLKEILSRADLPVIFVTGENISTTAAEAIRAGAQDYIIKLGDYLFALPIVIEKNIRLHQITKENERLQEKLERNNLQLQELLEKQRMMAETDHLTGLANRRRFGELLERYYGEAVRYGHDLTCCMCDLDHYKLLNDTLGHQRGDEVLRLTADIIRASLRGSDVGARYGGDEFVILLPHTSLKKAISAGERMRFELLDRSQIDPKLIRPVTMSIGVASLKSDHPISGDSLVSMADTALYVAKERGKDQIVSFFEIRDTAEQTHHT